MERDVGLRLHGKGWKEKWVERYMVMKGRGIGQRLYRKEGMDGGREKWAKEYNVAKKKRGGGAVLNAAWRLTTNRESVCW